MSGYANAPYGFGFAPDPFEPLTDATDAAEAERSEADEAGREPRFSYGAMHSAIKRNREWYR